MDGILLLIVVFVVGVAVYTLSLWVAAKLLGDEGKFLEFFIISAIASVVGLIPYVGGLASIVVFFVLLKKLMDISLLKGIVICLIALILRFGILLALSDFLVDSVEIPPDIFTE